MAQSREFKKALDETLASITPIEDSGETSECPDAEAIIAHIRGAKVDDTVGEHIASCAACGEIAADTRRRQKIYERQKAAFVALAEKKYAPVPVLNETFRPFAWMLQLKALVAEGAAACAILALAFAFYSPSLHKAVGNIEGSTAVSTFAQIEKSDPEKPTSSVALLNKLRSNPELVGQVDASRVAQVRFAVGEKKAAVENNTALADQWDDVDGKLTAIEFVAHYNSLRKQTEGSGIAKLASFEGKDGSVTVTFDTDPISDSRDSKLLSTSAVETRGLNQVTILAPKVHWQLDSKDDFAVAAVANSLGTAKQQ